jgi:hypothetical protein
MKTIKLHEIINKNHRIKYLNSVVDEKTAIISTNYNGAEGGI